MRLVIQRVREASVTIDGEVVSSIGAGLFILVGVETGDTEADMEWLVSKTAAMRIFDDENGVMNRSVVDVDGELLAVSQFTLCGDCRHGKRPSFTAAAAPDVANAYYERFVDGCRKAGLPVETGIFRAHMLVELVNNGPVTILLDSTKLL